MYSALVFAIFFKKHHNLTKFIKVALLLVIIIAHLTITNKKSLIWVIIQKKESEGPKDPRFSRFLFNRD